MTTMQPVGRQSAGDKPPSLLMVLLVLVLALAWAARHRPAPPPRPTIEQLEHEVLDGYLFHVDCRSCMLARAYESVHTPGG